MYEDLGMCRLKSGEAVQLGVIAAPDIEWADRIEKLLGHKGDPWNWQNSQVLRGEAGIEAYFYVLHREGRPFSNIMTVEARGVGLFGHVWTNPEDRRQGAASLIMGRQMAHFRERGGQALILGTEYDTPPYHIYRKFGFEGIEPQSDYMAYYASSREKFESAYFATGDTEIVPVDWPHWPGSVVLFTGDFPGLVRCAPLGLIGRRSTEGPLLPLILAEGRRREAGKRPRGVALEVRDTRAVAGLGVWDWDVVWPGTCLVDVWCHPDHWRRGAELFVALELPEADRYLAYGDAYCAPKQALLEAQGFRGAGALANRIARDAAKTGFADALIFERA